MPDVVEPTTPDKESSMWGVSVRALIIIVLTLTVCIMSLLLMKIGEPLYSAFTLALGFYFGQKTQTGGK